MPTDRQSEAAPALTSVAEIRELIKECLRSLNRERPSEDRINVSDDTPLLTDESQLDSLDFVSLSVDLEERLRALTGRDFELAPSALAEDEHPMRDVGTLAEYILGKLYRN
jgi:acyl carrier protein